MFEHLNGHDVTHECSLCQIRKMYTMCVEMYCLFFLIECSGMERTEVSMATIENIFQGLHKLKINQLIIFLLIHFHNVNFQFHLS